MSVTLTCNQSPHAKLSNFSCVSYIEEVDSETRMTVIIITEYYHRLTNNIVVRMLILTLHWYSRKTHP